MNNNQIVAMRSFYKEITDQKATCLYNTETKTLEIRSGRMAGKYFNIEYQSALEIIRAN